MKKKKANVLQKYCVACGCCTKACPKDAISIIDGIYATVDNDKCIGCGLCDKACPASIIKMEAIS